MLNLERKHLGSRAINPMFSGAFLSAIGSCYYYYFLFVFSRTNKVEEIALIMVVVNEVIGETLDFRAKLNTAAFHHFIGYSTDLSGLIYMLYLLLAEILSNRRSKHLL